MASIENPKKKQCKKNLKTTWDETSSMKEIKPNNGTVLAFPTFYNEASMVLIAFDDGLSSSKERGLLN